MMTVIVIDTTYKELVYRGRYHSEIKVYPSYQQAVITVVITVMKTEKSKVTSDVKVAVANYCKYC